MMEKHYTSTGTNDGRFIILEENERSDRDCGNLIGKDREHMFVSATSPTVAFFRAILFSRRTYLLLFQSRCKDNYFLCIKIVID